MLGKSICIKWTPTACSQYVKLPLLEHSFPPQAQTFSCLNACLGVSFHMCGRLNQFASIPALSLAGKELRIERRKKKKEEDKKSEVQVINNICPTDYAEVLTVADGEIGIDRMRFGLVPSWAKGTKAEVGKEVRPYLQCTVREHL